MKHGRSFKKLFQSKGASSSVYGQIPSIPILATTNCWKDDETPLEPNNLYHFQQEDFLQGEENFDRSNALACNSAQNISQEEEYDFLVPSDHEKWTLPQYESLFHHMFVQKQDEVCLMEQPEVIIQNAEKQNSNKKFQQWLKTLFSRSSPSSEKNQEEKDKDARDEFESFAMNDIPIEICEKLRHIHVYL